MSAKSPAPSPSRSAPRRRPSLRASNADLTRERDDLRRRYNGLLDILNAACLAAGGALVIAEGHWAAARRHELEYQYLPGRVVIRPARTPMNTIADRRSGQKDAPVGSESTGAENGLVLVKG